MSKHVPGTVEGQIKFSEPKNFEAKFTIPANVDPNHPEERKITYTGTIDIPSEFTYNPGTEEIKASLQHTSESTLGEHDYTAEKVGDNWKVTVISKDQKNALTVSNVPGTFFEVKKFSGKAALAKADGK